MAFLIRIVDDRILLICIVDDRIFRRGLAKKRHKACMCVCRKQLWQSREVAYECRVANIGVDPTWRGLQHNPTC